MPARLPRASSSMAWGGGPPAAAMAAAAAGSSAGTAPPDTAGRISDMATSSVMSPPILRRFGRWNPKESVMAAAYSAREAMIQGWENDHSLWLMSTRAMPKTGMARM